jgi:hypothetical protein
MVMAQIYAINGDYDKALDQIEYLLSIPSFVSVEGLRVARKHEYPWWKALREQPRFEQILAKGQLVL